MAQANWTIIPENGGQKNTGQHEACFVQANNGKAYLIGGRIRSPPCEYDPSIRTWNCNKNQIPLDFLHHMQCLAIGDDIWIPTAWTGEFPDEDNVDKILIYSPNTDTWSDRTGLPP